MRLVFNDATAETIAKLGGQQNTERFVVAIPQDPKREKAQQITQQLKDRKVYRDWFLNLFKPYYLKRHLPECIKKWVRVETFWIPNSESNWTQIFVIFMVKI